MTQTIESTISSIYFLFPSLPTSLIKLYVPSLITISSINQYHSLSPLIVSYNSLFPIYVVFESIESVHPSISTIYSLFLNNF